MYTGADGPSRHRHTQTDRGRSEVDRSGVRKSKSTLAAVQFAGKVAEANAEEISKILEQYRAYREGSAEDILKREVREVTQGSYFSFAGWTGAETLKEQLDMANDQIKALSGDLNGRVRTIQTLLSRFDELHDSQKQDIRLYDELLADQAASDLQKSNYLGELKVTNKDLYDRLMATSQSDTDYINVMKGHAEELQRRIAKKNEELAHLQGSLRDASGNINRLQHQITQLQEKNKTLIGHNSDWQSAHGELKAKNDQLSSQLSDAEQRSDTNYRAYGQVDTELKSTKHQVTELTRQIRESSTHLRDQEALQSELSTKRQEAEQYSHLYSDQVAKVSDLTEINQGWSNDYVALQESSKIKEQELTSQLYEQRLELQRAESNISKLQDQMEYLQTKKDELEESVAKHKNYVRSQQQFARAVTDTKKINEEEITVLNSKLHEAERQIAAFSERQLKLQNEKDMSQTRLAKLESDLGSKLKYMGQEKLTMSEANALLRNQLEKEKSDLARLKSELETTQELAKNAKTMKDELIKTQKNSHSLVSRNIRLQAQLKTSNEELKNAQAQQAESQGLYEKLKVSEPKLKRELKQAKSDLSATREKVKTLEAVQQQNADQRAELKQLEKDKVQANAQIKNLTEQRELAERGLKKEKSEVDGQKIKFQVQQKSISSLRSKIKEFEGKERSLTTELNTANSSLHTARENKNQLVRNYAELQSRLDTQLARMSEQPTTDIAAKDTEVETLKSKIAVLVEEVSQAEASLERATQKHTEVTSSLKAELVTLTTDKNQLRSSLDQAQDKQKQTERKLEAANSARSTSEKKFIELQNELGSAENKVARLETTRNHLSTENARLANEVTRLRDETLGMEDIKGENQSLRTANDKSKAQYKELETKRDSAQKELSEVTQELQTLEQSTSQHNSKLLEKNLEIQQLRSELATIQERYDALDKQLVTAISGMDGPSGAMPSLPAYRTTVDYNEEDEGEFSLSTHPNERSELTYEPVDSNQRYSVSPLASLITARTDTVSQEDYDDLFQEKEIALRERDELIDQKWDVQESKDNLDRAEQKVTKLELEKQTLKSKNLSQENEIDRLDTVERQQQNEITKLKAELARMAAERQTNVNVYNDDIEEVSSKHLNEMTRANLAESKLHEIEKQSQLDRDELVQLSTMNQGLQAFVGDFTEQLKKYITDENSQKYIDQVWLEAIKHHTGGGYDHQPEGDYIEED